MVYFVPEELVDLILQFVSEQDSLSVPPPLPKFSSYLPFATGTAFVCSLVCRSWLRMSRARVFKNVNLDNTTMLDAFLRLLDGGTFRYDVHILRIQRDRESKSISRLFSQLHQLLPMVHSLHLANIDLVDHLPAIFCHNLKQVALQGCYIRSTAQLRDSLEGSSLEKLTLENTWALEDIGPFQRKSSITPHKIRELTVTTDPIDHCEEDLLDWFCEAGGLTEIRGLSLKVSRGQIGFATHRFIGKFGSYLTSLTMCGYLVTKDLALLAETCQSLSALHSFHLVSGNGPVWPLAKCVLTHITTTQLRTFTLELAELWEFEMLRIDSVFKIFMEESAKFRNMKCLVLILSNARAGSLELLETWVKDSLRPDIGALDMLLKY